MFTLGTNRRENFPKASDPSSIIAISIDTERKQTFETTVVTSHHFVDTETFVSSFLLFRVLLMLVPEGGKVAPQESPGGMY